MNTGFRPGRIEDELCLAVLLQHRIVAGNHNRAVGIPIRSNANSKYCEIDAEGDQCRRQNEEDNREEDSPEAISQSKRLGHEARL